MNIACLYAAASGRLKLTRLVRAHRWQQKDPELCEKAFARALELLDLTIGDARWKELTPVRELLCDAMLGGKEYGSYLASLDRYFYPFAVAARAGR